MLPPDLRLVLSGRKESSQESTDLVSSIDRLVELSRWPLCCLLQVVSEEPSRCAINPWPRMTGQILERHVVRMQLAIDGMLQLNWLKRAVTKQEYRIPPL